MPASPSKQLLQAAAVSCLCLATLFACCSSEPTDAGDSGPVDSGALSCWYAEDSKADLASLLCSWKLHPSNPLIQPPSGEWLIGDPSVVSPQEAPDGRWHLFANSLLGIHHHTSADGISWKRHTPSLFGTGAFRAFLIREGAAYYLFFEKFVGFSDSTIQVSTSKDLERWSTPLVVLKPELSWEKELTRTVGNPYVMKREGNYWLYYSASSVRLDDAGFNEPRHIGLARATTITGPYVKEPQPIISPSKDEPLRNHGAGSIKLLTERVGGRWIALNNGIYLDPAGKSRSAIMVLSSEDGVKWSKVCSEAILAPTDKGWMSSFVYAFDTVRVGDDIRVYFNAREGWKKGTERIGMAALTLPCKR